MIKAAIFDADGTLLDSMKIWMEVSPRFIESKGKKSNPELERKLFSMSMEQGAELLKKEFGFTETVEEMKAGILEIVGDFYRNEVQLKAGARELLQNLNEKGIRMCVSSASDRKLLTSAFTRLGVIDYFDRIFTCQELKISKSDPAVYTTVSDYMEASVEETVVFEDSLHAITTAKKAGFKVIAIEDVFSKKDEDEIRKLADLYVHDFTEVEDL